MKKADTFKLNIILYNAKRDGVISQATYNKALNDIMKYDLSFDEERLPLLPLGAEDDLEQTNEQRGQ